MKLTVANSQVERLVKTWQASALISKEQYQQAPRNVRAAVEPLTLIDAARLLVAMATDCMGGVQQRNNRTDVNDGVASLRVAVAMLQAIDADTLDG